MTARERFRELYAPIRAHIWGWEREWLDDVLACGNIAEIVDATRYCRDRIDEIQRTKAEVEA